MNSDKFLKQTEYAQSIAQLLEEYEGASAEATKARNYIAMAEQVRQHDKALKLKDHVAGVDATLQAIITILNQRTGRDGIAATRDFLDELSSKLEFAGKLRAQAVNAKAAFDLSVRLNQFTTVEERAEAEKDLAERRGQFDAAVDLAGELVPAVSNIIITSAPSVPVKTPLSLV
jgi:hypothetical protein